MPPDWQQHVSMVYASNATQLPSLPPSSNTSATVANIAMDSDSATNNNRDGVIDNDGHVHDHNNDNRSRPSSIDNTIPISTRPVTTPSYEAALASVAATSPSSMTPNQHSKYSNMSAANASNTHVRTFVANSQPIHIFVMRLKKLG
jgi:hypothetical protein